MNILITGGASGLGKAITTQLIKDKKNIVYFTYFQSYSEAKRMQNIFSNAHGIKCNFLKKVEVDNLKEKIKKINLDVLINNAIVKLRQEYFHKMSALEILQSFQENILPVIEINQAAITIFRKNRFGKIITILSSYLTDKPPIGLSVYVAEKSYLMSLAKSWAIENAKFNVTSNFISPSPMLTELQKTTDPRKIQQMIENHPLKKLLTVGEVAKAVEFYANCSQQINGNNLIMNATENVV